MIVCKQLAAIAFFLVLGIHSQGLAQEQPLYWLDGKWPHEKSDLPPHDKAVYGRLDNGFRYIIQENANPVGRISVQLLVQAGSLMERDNERGVAHFLEHLAYNGTKNFPAGELIPFFQSNGMSFGKDVNAYTSLKETVYKLNILNKKESIDDAFVFMHDVAEGISIAANEVESERGVIISEKNSRDSEQFRARHRYREFLYAGTEFEHDTIGTEEVIRTVTPQTIKDFYDAWYRPEYMILLVVGSVDPAEIESLIQAKFGDLQARAPKRHVFPFRENDLKGVQTFYNQYKSEFTSAQILRMEPLRWVDDSLDIQKDMLFNSMASSIVSARLRHKINSGEAPFFSGVARYTENSGFFPTALLVASSEASAWQESFEHLQDSLRVALEFGFFPEEVDEAKKTMMLTYKRKADLAEQEQNDEIIKNMIACFMANRVYQSWEQTYVMYKDLIDNMQADDLYTAFQDMWGDENRILAVTGNAHIDNADETLTNLWTAGLTKPIEAVAAPSAIKYPYIPLPEKAGEVISHKEIPIKNTALVLHEITFANGLLLRVLPTPFAKGKLHVELAIGAGSDAIADANFMLYKVAADMDQYASLGNIVRSDVLRLQSTENISLKIGLGSDSLTLTSNGESQFLEKNLEAMWTQYKDPSISLKDQELSMRGYAIKDAERFSTLPNAMQVAMRRLFWKESVRNEPITEAVAMTFDLKSLQDALKKLYAESGAPVLNMVGDVDVAAAINLSGKTFGADDVSWPVLQDAPYHVDYAFASSGKREEHIDIVSELDQASLRLAFHRPLKDAFNRKALLVRRLVASILGDEIRQAIREKAGASYSPRVLYWYSDVDGYGLYMVSIDTQHENFAQMREEIVRIVENFVKEGVDAQTLQRMKRPSIGSWMQSSKQNRIYTSFLTQMARKNYPYLEWHSDFVDMIKSITLEEVNAEIQQAFTKDNRALLTGITGR